MAGLAPKLPLVTNQADGYQLLQTVKDMVKQNMKNLCLTSPGERIMYPDFGVGLRSFLFEQDDDFLREAIKNTINKQVDKYMPFVQLQNVTVYNPGMLEFESPNTLKVSIAYSIIPLTAKDVLELSL